MGASPSLELERRILVNQLVFLAKIQKIADVLIVTG